MAELGFRPTEILAPLVPEAAEAAFLPTLPGVDLDLSTLVDATASIRLENGNLILAPAFGPVIVLQDFTAATADRPVALVLPGGTVIPSDRLLDLLASPVDFSIADVISLRPVVPAPEPEPILETTGSVAEPAPIPPQLRPDEAEPTRLADIDIGPPETVRGRSPDAPEQGSVAGEQPDIPLAPPPPTDTADPAMPPPPFGERSEPAPRTVDLNDTLSLSAPALGMTVDLGAGQDTLILAEGTNAITVRNTEFIRGGAGDDTVRVDGAPALIDLGEGSDTLDLSVLSRVSLAGAGNQYRGVETVDLRGGTGTTLTLSAADVLDLSSGTDRLLVQGDNDTVVPGSGWAAVPGATPTGDPATVYTQPLAGRTATLIVESDISVA